MQLLVVFRNLEKEFSYEKSTSTFLDHLQNYFIYSIIWPTTPSIGGKVTKYNPNQTSSKDKRTNIIS